MYKPFPAQNFENLERDLWFQEMVEHIRPQAESEPYVTDLVRTSELPPPARALYFLWMFYAEVGGNGIEYFLLEQQGHFTPQVHEALRLVGAPEVLERLEAGIPHAVASDCAEFSTGPDLDWFRRFQPNAKYPTFQSVDEDIYEWVEDDLLEKANAFIETWKDLLVA